MQQNEAKYVESMDIGVLKESGHGKKVLESGLRGGPAWHLLQPEAANVFWDSGSSRDDWVIFQFPRLGVFRVLVLLLTFLQRCHTVWL
jgi:hypothetical protein